MLIGAADPTGLASTWTEHGSRIICLSLLKTVQTLWQIFQVLPQNNFFLKYSYLEANVMQDMSHFTPDTCMKSGLLLQWQYSTVPTRSTVTIGYNLQKTTRKQISNFTTTKLINNNNNNKIIMNILEFIRFITALIIKI